MTATETMTTNDTWTKQLDQLRARYKHLRPAVLAALNVLVHDENISDDDAKARAAAHGVRITAASLNAARTVMSRMDATPAANPTTPVPATPKQPRRPRAADTPVDVAALISGVVEKIQGRGNAEVDKLRDAVRKAIATLQGAVG